MIRQILMYKDGARVEKVNITTSNTLTHSTNDTFR